MQGPITQLVPTQYITNVATAIYTSPLTAGGNGLTRVNGWIIANTDSSDRTITWYNVPSGGSTGGDNTIMPGVTIKANNSWFHMKEAGLIIIPAGGALWMVASVTNKVTITLFGQEIT